MATKNRKVQVESGVDATGARKGFSEIKDAAKDMSKAVAQEGQAAGKGVEAVGAGSDVAAAKIERNTKSMVAQLQRLTAEARAGSKNSPEYFNERAKQLGIDPAALQPYLKDLAQVQRATRAAQGSLDGMGMSAKATSAALRQVPAQFTDIVTSLQGGQAPLTVFLQQGGQLRDVFGGAGPAAKALGGYVLGLVTPFTLAGGAALALSYAYNKGSEEDAAFRRSVILTGGAAGAAARELASMAAAVSEGGSGTRGRAAEIINQMAQDSAIGAGNLKRFAAAALELEKVGGPAAEETAKAFSALAKNPLEAALKLNEGTNFLTTSIYEQVRALDQQGRASEAAAVAQGAYFDAIQQRTPQLVASLGYIERAWIGIKEAAKGTGDFFLNIGRDQTDDEQLKILQGRIAQRAASRSIASRGGKRQSTFDQEDAADQAALTLLSRRLLLQREVAGAEYVRNEQLKKAAEFDKEALQYEGKKLQLKKELERIENLGFAAGKSPAEIEQAKARASEKFADKTKPKADINDRSSVDAIKRELGELTGAYADAERLMAAQRQAGAISEADYYIAKQALIAQSRDAQVASLREQNQQLEELNSNPKLSPESRLANEKAIADNTARMVRVNNEAAASSQVLGIQQVSALAGIERAYQDARLAAEDFLTTLVRNQNREIEFMGAGRRTRDIAAGRDEILDRYDAERRRIRNERDRVSKLQGGKLDDAQAADYDNQLKLQDEFEQKRLALYDAGLTRRLAGEAKWQTGASEAFRNYLDDAENVAGQSERAFVNAFGSLESAITVTNGHIKLSFTSLADSILADLARIALKQAAVTGLKAAATFFGIPFANGGAFDPMGEIKRFARGDVFDQPTAFSYAGGSRAGVLGEAGPEAIMPLARGAGGQLGVRVAEGGKSAASIVYAPQIMVDGTADRARALQDTQALIRRGHREFADMLRAEGVLA